ncbi:MAG TPA: M23 family metallopeptidase [Dermatophilaceae bacterium]|nr:M23 family metallopeptidase [Dermatophilaceae bacterium]
MALPTSAAVALMFCAAGAAVATSPRTQSVAFGQNGSGANSAQPSAAESAALRARHLKEIEQAQALVKASRAKALAHNLAVDRATAVARGVERKKLAARAIEAKRAALVHSWRLPLANPVVSSGFGYRWGRLHAGQDYAVSTGTTLVSMSTGTVVFAGVQGGYGNLVKIRYWDGTVSFYGHMSSLSVHTGQAVAPGKAVGQSGNTGHSTGPHLHLEIHPGGGEPVNPASWLASRNVPR